MIKNAAISARILSKINEGMGLREAFNAVLGDGAYEKLAGEIYDELRAR